MGLRAKLKDDVTYWPVTGSNGFGGFTFGPPVLMKGRWEEKQELFLTPSGEEVLSQGIVYTDIDMPIGDYCMLGDLTGAVDPTLLSPSDGRAHRIRQRNRTTDLRGMTVLYKVFL